jgi:glycosyltransferase involved in cell wall biosynthesis
MNAIPAILSSESELETNQTDKSGRKLRIAVFTFSYAPFMTGIATCVHTRIRALLDLGHTVFLIRPEADSQFTEEIRSRRMRGIEEFSGNPNFSSATYPTKPHPLFRSHPEPRSHRHWSDTAMLEKFQPDVILTAEPAGMRGLTSLGFGGYGRTVGTQYATQKGIPAIALFETDWLYYGTRYLGRWFDVVGPTFQRPFLRRFCRHYRTTFFPSQVMLKKYQHNGAHPSEYVPVNGVDCVHFHPDNRRFDPIPEDRRPVLLFVGRMAREKSVSDLFEVIKKVRAVVPDAHLVIVGGGPEENRIRTLASKNADSTTFVGECFGDTLKGWYARADVYVNPSASENFCTTNMEAQASGAPLVAVAAGGNSEQVVEGFNGFLVPTHDTTAMAQRAIEILTSPSMRQSMSANAREFAQRFDIRECGRHLERALLACLAQK